MEDGRYKRPITVRLEYILGTDRRDFYNVGIREPRVLTDHFMILTKIKGYRVSRDQKYCKRWYTCPISVPKGAPMQEEYTIFGDLKKEVKKSMRTAQEKETWVSEATCRLVDQSISLRRRHTTDQRELWA